MTISIIQVVKLNLKINILFEIYHIDCFTRQLIVTNILIEIYNIVK